MKAIVKFDFVEGGDTRHEEQFTVDVTQEVVDVINNDKAPFLAVSILAYDPTVPPTGEVIDLAKLYPDVDSDTFRKEYMACFVESVPVQLADGDFVDSETGVNGKGWPPTGQVRREDEGVDTNAVLEAIMDQADRFRRQSPQPVMPTWLRMRLAAVGLQPAKPERDSDQVHAIKYGLAAAARLISAPAGWPEGQPYDRWDQIIDEMDETDGAWNHFTTTRAEVRRAMQKAVGEDRLAQLDAAEYGRDDLNPDPSGDFKDISFITAPYFDLVPPAYADEADRLETPRVGWAEEDN